MFARKAVSVGFLGVLLVAVGLFGASPAFAGSPWWHVGVVSEPTRIQAGKGGDEQLELKVEGASGYFELEEPASEEFKGWEVGALPIEVQMGLEEIYGSGNVEVGPGALGSNSYLITFVGEYAYKQVKIAVGPREYVSVAGETLTEKHSGKPDGQIVLNVSNLGNGDASGGSEPISIVDKLPKGLKAVKIVGKGVNDALDGNGGAIPCSLVTLTCTDTGTVAPYEEAKVEIFVAVVEGAESGETDVASVSGGGAANVSRSQAIPVGVTPVGFGVEDYEMVPEEEGGAVDTQAGSHPYQLTTTLALNESAPETVPALAKNLSFKFPAGTGG